MAEGLESHLDPLLPSWPGQQNFWDSSRSSSRSYSSYISSNSCRSRSRSYSSYSSSNSSNSSRSWSRNRSYSSSNSRSSSSYLSRAATSMDDFDTSCEDIGYRADYNTLKAEVKEERTVIRSSDYQAWVYLTFVWFYPTWPFLWLLASVPYESVIRQDPCMNKLF